MRDIKFRAFNPVSKEYSYADVCETDEMNEWITWELPEGSPTNTGTRWDVEQFTGLQDKNGADIYESDVIKDYIGVGVVEYKERYAAFRVKYTNPAGRGKWFLDYNLRGERESLEVIGNIFQNKEILND